MGNAALNYLFTNQIDMVLEFTVAAVLELLAHWRGRFLMNNREILLCSSLKAISERVVKPLSVPFIPLFSVDGLIS